MSESCDKYPSQFPKAQCPTVENPNRFNLLSYETEKNSKSSQMKSWNWEEVWHFFLYSATQMYAHVAPLNQAETDIRARQGEIELELQWWSRCHLSSRLHRFIIGSDETDGPVGRRRGGATVKVQMHARKTRLSTPASVLCFKVRGVARVSFFPVFFSRLEFN